MEKHNRFYSDIGMVYFFKNYLLYFSTIKLYYKGLIITGKIY